MSLEQIKKARILAIISLIIVLLLFLVTFYIIRSNRTVGYLTGNKIYYKDLIYEETYEVIDLKVGRCLGMIEWTDSKDHSKIYRIRNHPDYIYLSMMTDHRIYKLID